MANPRPRSPQNPTQSTIALNLLEFIATDADRLERFCGLSGLTIDDFREGLAKPSFLAMAFDQALQDEELMIGFATEHKLTPEDIARARRGLPGAEGHHDF
jgi:Protein of unknown function (DUF3572)